MPAAVLATSDKRRPEESGICMEREREDHAKAWGRLAVAAGLHRLAQSARLAKTANLGTPWRRSHGPEGKGFSGFLRFWGGSRASNPWLARDSGRRLPRQTHGQKKARTAKPGGARWSPVPELSALFILRRRGTKWAPCCAWSLGLAPFYPPGPSRRVPGQPRPAARTLTWLRDPALDGLHGRHGGRRSQPCRQRRRPRIFSLASLFCTRRYYTAMRRIRGVRTASPALVCP